MSAGAAVRIEFENQASPAAASLLPHMHQCRQNRKAASGRNHSHQREQQQAHVLRLRKQYPAGPVPAAQERAQEQQEQEYYHRNASAHVYHEAACGSASSAPASSLFSSFLPAFAPSLPISAAALSAHSRICDALSYSPSLRAADASLTHCCVSGDHMAFVCEEGLFVKNERKRCGADAPIVVRDGKRVAEWRGGAKEKRSFLVIASPTPGCNAEWMTRDGDDCEHDFKAVNGGRVALERAFQALLGRRCKDSHSRSDKGQDYTSSPERSTACYNGLSFANKCTMQDGLLNSSWCADAGGGDDTCLRISATPCPPPASLLVSLSQPVVYVTVFYSEPMACSVTLLLDVTGRLRLWLYDETQAVWLLFLEHELLFGTCTQVWQETGTQGQTKAQSLSQEQVWINRPETVSSTTSTWHAVDDEGDAEGGDVGGDEDVEEREGIDLQEEEIQEEWLQDPTLASHDQYLSSDTWRELDHEASTTHQAHHRNTGTTDSTARHCSKAKVPRPCSPSAHTKDKYRWRIVSAQYYPTSQRLVWHQHEESSKSTSERDVSAASGGSTTSQTRTTAPWNPTGGNRVHQCTLDLQNRDFVNVSFASTIYSTEKCVHASGHGMGETLDGDSRTAGSKRDVIEVRYASTGCWISQLRLSSATERYTTTSGVVASLPTQMRPQTRVHPQTHIPMHTVKLQIVFFYYNQARSVSIPLEVEIELSANSASAEATVEGLLLECSCALSSPLLSSSMSASSPAATASAASSTTTSAAAAAFEVERGGHALSSPIGSSTAAAHIAIEDDVGSKEYFYTVVDGQYLLCLRYDAIHHRLQLVTRRSLAKIHRRYNALNLQRNKQKQISRHQDTDCRCNGSSVHLSDLSSNAMHTGKQSRCPPGLNVKLKMKMKLLTCHVNERRSILSCSLTGSYVYDGHGGCCQHNGNCTSSITRGAPMLLCLRLDHATDIRDMAICSSSETNENLRTNAACIDRDDDDENSNEEVAADANATDLEASNSLGLAEPTQDGIALPISIVSMTDYYCTFVETKQEWNETSDNKDIWSTALRDSVADEAFDYVRLDQQMFAVGQPQPSTGPKANQAIDVAGGYVSTFGTGLNEAYYKTSNTGYPGSKEMLANTDSPVCPLLVFRTKLGRPGPLLWDIRCEPSIVPPLSKPQSFKGRRTVPWSETEDQRFGCRSSTLQRDTRDIIASESDMLSMLWNTLLPSAGRLQPRLLNDLGSRREPRYCQSLGEVPSSQLDIGGISRAAPPTLNSCIVDTAATSTNKAAKNNSVHTTAPASSCGTLASSSFPSSSFVSRDYQPIRLGVMEEESICSLFSDPRDILGHDDHSILANDADHDNSSSSSNGDNQTVAWNEGYALYTAQLLSRLDTKAPPCISSLPQRDCRPAATQEQVEQRIDGHRTEPMVVLNDAGVCDTEPVLGTNKDMAGPVQPAALALGSDVSPPGPALHTVDVKAPILCTKESSSAAFLWVCSLDDVTLQCPLLQAGISTDSVMQRLKLHLGLDTLLLLMQSISTAHHQGHCTEPTHENGDASMGREEGSSGEFRSGTRAVPPLDIATVTVGYSLSRSVHNVLSHAHSAGDGLCVMLVQWLLLLEMDIVHAVSRDQQQQHFHLDSWHQQYTTENCKQGMSLPSVTVIGRLCKIWAAATIETYRARLVAAQITAASLTPQSPAKQKSKRMEQISRRNTSQLSRLLHIMHLCGTSVRELVGIMLEFGHVCPAALLVRKVGSGANALNATTVWASQEETTQDDLDENDADSSMIAHTYRDTDCVEPLAMRNEQQAATQSTPDTLRCDTGAVTNAAMSAVRSPALLTLASHTSRRVVTLPVVSWVISEWNEARKGFGSVGWDEGVEGRIDVRDALFTGDSNTLPLGETGNRGDGNTIAMKTGQTLRRSSSASPIGPKAPFDSTTLTRTSSAAALFPSSASSSSSSSSSSFSAASVSESLSSQPLMGATAITADLPTESSPHSCLSALGTTEGFSDYLSGPVDFSEYRSALSVAVFRYAVPRIVNYCITYELGEGEGEDKEHGYLHASSHRTEQWTGEQTHTGEKLTMKKEREKKRRIHTLQWLLSCLRRGQSRCISMQETEDMLSPLTLVLENEMATFEQER